MGRKGPSRGPRRGRTGGLAAAQRRERKEGAAAFTPTQDDAAAGDPEKRKGRGTLLI